MSFLSTKFNLLFVTEVWKIVKQRFDLLFQVLGIVFQVNIFAPLVNQPEYVVFFLKIDSLLRPHSRLSTV